MTIPTNSQQDHGMIVFKDDEYAQYIKQAIERVSTITKTEGNKVFFEGRRIIDALDELLERAPDQQVARRAHGLLVQKNLVHSGH